MSKKEKVISGNYIEDYLKNRENIALIIFLLDIRHNPTEDDMLMYDYYLIDTNTLLSKDTTQHNFNKDIYLEAK